MLATPPERLGFAHGNDGSTIPETDEDGNVIYPEAKLEVENGLHQLETLLEANVDKAFDKFEIYVLRNILTVPEDLLSWVRLKHYEVCGMNWAIMRCVCLFAKGHVLTRFATGSLLHLLARHAHTGIHPCTAQKATRDQEIEPLSQRRMQS